VGEPPEPAARPGSLFPEQIESAMSEIDLLQLLSLLSIVEKLLRQ
jgi:hypothetical protein